MIKSFYKLLASEFHIFFYFIKYKEEIPPTPFVKGGDIVFPKLFPNPLLQRGSEFSHFFSLIQSVPEEGIEPSWSDPHDFESCASTNFATPANLSL